MHNEPASARTWPKATAASTKMDRQQRRRWDQGGGVVNETIGGQLNLKYSVCHVRIQSWKRGPKLSGSEVGPLGVRRDDRLREIKNTSNSQNGTHTESVMEILHLKACNKVMISQEEERNQQDGGWGFDVAKR